MKKLHPFFASLLFVVLPSSAATFSFTPGPITENQGAGFTVDILITGGVDIYAWQFDVGFDPTILQAVSVDEGTYLAAGSTPTFFLPGFIDNAAGVISFNADSILGPYSGSNGNGWLATIGFSATGGGTSPLTLFNGIVLNSFGEGLEFDVQSGSVEVAQSSIPEPTSALLIAAGLVVLGCIRRLPRS